MVILKAKFSSKFLDICPSSFCITVYIKKKTLGKEKYRSMDVIKIG
jgi:hypothetical protein